MGGRLYLVRHAETALNREGRIRGWDNPPLDDTGRAQANECALRFEGVAIAMVFASDLGRAMDTGRYIANRLNVSLAERRCLRPWNLGTFHGQKVADIIDDMKRLTVDETVPIQGGEPFREFRLRFLAELKDLIEKADAMQTAYLAVAHSRCLQIARAWDVKGRPSDLSIDVARMNDYSDELPPISHIEMDSTGLFKTFVPRGDVSPALDIGVGDVHLPGPMGAAGGYSQAKRVEMISAAKRKSLPRTKFALPDQKKYPIDTVARVRNAAARLSQQKKAGKISDGDYRTARAAIRRAAKKYGIHSELRATLGEPVGAGDGLRKEIRDQGIGTNPVHDTVGGIDVHARLGAGGRLSVRHNAAGEVEVEVVRGAGVELTPESV